MRTNTKPQTYVLFLSVSLWKSWRVETELKWSYCSLKQEQMESKGLGNI